MTDNFPNDSAHFPDDAVGDTDPRPEMTRKEATFHASVAGVRGAEAAKAAGNDPAHTRALGTAAVGGIELRGLALQLPSAYSALAVPAVAELMETHGLRIMQLQSDCLFIAAFHKPRDVYRLAVVQADAPAARLLLDLANDIALALETREAIDEVVAWCLEAFQRLNGVKKPSPAEATPPAAQAGTAAPSAATRSSSDSSVAPTAAAPAGSSPSSMS